MIEAESTTVFKAYNGKRYLTVKGAAEASARALMKKHYPDDSNTISPGPYGEGQYIERWGWVDCEEHRKTFARLVRALTSQYKRSVAPCEAPNQHVTGTKLKLKIFQKLI